MSKSAKDREAIRQAVLDGKMSLDQAAKALGGKIPAEAAKTVKGKRNR